MSRYYVLNVNVTPLIFNLTLLSAAHSNLTASSVSSMLIIAVQKEPESVSYRSYERVSWTRKWRENIPSSPTLNPKLLYGSLPECPCLGGAPGMKKLEKLLPTYNAPVHQLFCPLQPLPPSR
jgi:hypothetical protein